MRQIESDANPAFNRGVELKPTYISSPMVAVLSSYHGKYAEAFDQAGIVFKGTNARLIHPPTFKLIDPDTSGFVLREGDPAIPHHILQIHEMRNMLEIGKQQSSGGFGYVLNELDGTVGQHTIGEMAFLAYQGIPNVASREITGFRGIPRYAQDVAQRTVQAFLPIGEVTSESLGSVARDLREQGTPTFDSEDKRILRKLIQNALLEQRYEDGLSHVALASKSHQKQAAFIDPVKDLYSSSAFVLVDPISTDVPEIPEQPFQHQGTQGAHSRIEQVIQAGEGLAYKGYGAYENFLGAYDPKWFRIDEWATPNRLATDDQISSIPEELIYADVACFAYYDPVAGKTRTAYSKPVIVPTAIALEARRRGPDTLYSKVLQERDSGVVLDDPHSSLGDYSRIQQLTDVTKFVLSRV